MLSIYWCGKGYSFGEAIRDLLCNHRAEELHPRLGLISGSPALA